MVLRFCLQEHGGDATEEVFSIWCWSKLKKTLAKETEPRTEKAHL